MKPLLPTAAILLCITPAHSGELDLRGGSYEVAVRLELPHVDSGAERIVTICIDPAGPGATMDLAVLSENNPLAACPASNVQGTPVAMSFDIKCPGGNAAVATARYTFQGDRFEARIAMKMGGKNMTMTEVQRGRRTGACVSKAPPS